MEQAENQVEVAYIEGRVRIPELPGYYSQGNVTVYAENVNGRDRASVSVKPSRIDELFSLLLSPGKWSVWAEIGPVKSGRRTIELAANETKEINFCFGPAT